jgi:hypothetical protein
VSADWGGGGGMLGEGLLGISAVTRFLGGRVALKGLCTNARDPAVIAMCLGKTRFVDEAWEKFMVVEIPFG